RSDSLEFAINFQNLSTLQAQTFCATHRQKRNPVIRYFGRKLVTQRAGLAGGRSRWKLLLLEAGKRSLAGTFDYALDTPGQIRHFISEEQNFLNRPVL